MPIYQYKAIALAGKSKAGVVDAESPRDARVKLRKAGVHVTEIAPVPEGEGSTGSKALRMPSFLGGRNLAELAMVTRQLATLIGASIPVADAIEALVKQIRGTRFEGVFRGVKEKIVQGASFGNALAEYPSYFSELYINMVRAGEAAGNLDEILARLADFLRNQYRLRSKVSAALTYPAVMAFVGFSVVTFLMTFVVPNITQLLTRRGGEKALPLPTRILIGATELFTGEAVGLPMPVYWAIVIPVALALFALFRWAIRTEKGRLRWDTFIFAVPILGDLFKKQAISRFATTLSTLLKSGIPAAEALRIVQRVVGNKVLEKTIAEVHDRIMEGADISAPLQKSKVFPPVVGYMIAVGEQAGKLDEILTKVSEAYDEEIEITTQKVVSMIEPLMIVVMSVCVGFIVLAIILPIMEITRTVRRH